MDAKRKTSWLSRNIYAQNIQWNEIAHAHNQNHLCNTLYRLQFVCKQMQDESVDGMHFKIVRGSI